MSFRREFRSIAGLSVVLVVLSSLLLGWFFSASLDISLAWGIALGAIVFYNNIIMRVLGDVMWRWGQDNPVFRAIYLMLDALPQIVVCVALIVCGMWLVRGPKNKKGKQPAEEEPEDFHAYTAAPQAEDAEDAADTADTDAHFAMPELSALLGKPVTGAEQDETPAEDDDDRAE